VSKPLVGDTLLGNDRPTLALRAAKPTGGQSPVPDRAALSGILFVLKSSIPWDMLPQEMGSGRGVTCWQRRAWQKAGVWERLLHAFLERLGAADQSDWHRASADSARLSVSALERHS
jgi:transposase